MGKPPPISLSELSVLGGFIGVQEQAACAVSDLCNANSDNQTFVAEAGGIAPLIALLSGSAQAHEHATNALWHLAAQSENRLKIVRAGGIPPLVALLRIGSSEAQVSAAAVLSDLAQHSTDGQVQVAKAGGIAPLIALLLTGSMVAQERAACALSFLAANYENQVGH